MKLGPLTISLTERPPAAKPDLEEQGATGTTVAPTGTTVMAGGGGQSSRLQLLQQDYNPDLAYPAAYDIYDRMRLSDGTVSSLMKAIKLPLLATEWKVQPASDSAEDVAIADFVDADLNSMTTSLEETLRLILLMLDFGAMAFEKVWEMRDDNRVHLRKLGQRLPKSILFWYVDDGGGLTSIVQQVYKDGKFQTIEIPVEKLVVFVNDREGSNWRGTSLLRPAYKHWYYLDHFYAIDAIAKQRRGAGVDVGRIKEAAGDKKAVKAAVERVLMGLNVHEKQFVTEAEDEWEYRIESIQGNLPRMQESIDHHVNMILSSMLASFLILGHAERGSHALSKDQSAFFLMALRAVGGNVETTMNEQVIKPLVDYNFPNVKAYPTLKHGRIETRNVAEFAAAVAQLMGAGAVTPGADVEASSREVLELPEQQDGEAVYAAKGAAAAQAAKDAAEAASQPPPTPIRRAMARRITFADPPNADEAKRLQEQAALALQEAAQRLADEEDDEETFVADSHSILKDAFLSAFMLGVGNGGGPRSGGSNRAGGSTWAESAADSQKAYLDGFASDIASGALSVDAINARAAQYAGQVWTGYQRGIVDIMAPGSRIIWHAEGDGATCDLCDSRDGEEYTEDTLPGFPGEGGFGDLCDGAANCRCWLESVESDDTSLSLVTFGEPVSVKCPTCRNRLPVSRRVIGEAVVFCRGCKADYVVTGSSARKLDDSES